jgi:hypothetical protein
MVVWSGQNVVVRSSLHDIQMLRVHIHGSLPHIFLVRVYSAAKQPSKNFQNLLWGASVIQTMHTMCVSVSCTCTQSILMPGPHVVKSLVERCCLWKIQISAAELSNFLWIRYHQHILAGNVPLKHGSVCVSPLRQNLHTKGHLDGLTHQGKLLDSYI